MAQKECYLRPIADIQLEHTTYINLDPDVSDEVSETGYNLINEEIADLNTSYIEATMKTENTDGGDYTSIFELGGEIPTDLQSIENIKIGLVLEADILRDQICSGAYHEITLNLNDEIFQTQIQSYNGNFQSRFSDLPELESGTISEADDYFSLFYDTAYSDDFDTIYFDFYDCKDYLENYIKNNQSLPLIKVTIHFHYDSFSANTSNNIGEDSDLKEVSNLSVDITQLYLKIIYQDSIKDIISSIGTNIAGAYRPINKIYYKQNSKWNEINTNTLKNLISKNNYIAANINEVQNYPMLLPQNNWLKYKDIIFNKVSIVDSYIPTGEETKMWFADVNQQGDITCYILNDEIIIAGNGSGGIYLNPDSSYLFYNNYHSVPYKIIGMKLLHCFPHLNTKKDNMFYNVDFSLDTFSPYSLSTTYTNCIFDQSSWFLFITMPVIDSLEYIIPEKAFKNVVASDDYIISGVKQILKEAFFNNAHLKNIGRWGGSSNLQYIGKQAFMRCRQLKQWGSTENTLDFLTTSLTYIDDFAFEGIALDGKNLSVIFPSSLTHIGRSAFNTASLSNVDFSQATSLTYIGPYAFRDNNFTQIEIPANVSYIGNYAFNSEVLTTVIMKSLIPPSISSNTFKTNDNLQIIVPKGYLSAYQSAWTDYSNYLIESET